MDVVGSPVGGLDGGDRGGEGVGWWGMGLGWAGWRGWDWDGSDRERESVREGWRGKRWSLSGLARDC